MTGTATPETSVVIRAMNEERWLPDVMNALDKQTYRNFEVLLVDSGSIDRTREIAAAHGARIIRIPKEEFTFGHALNVGIREARGSLIANVSAHAIPVDEHWLERLVAPLREQGIAMVYGGQRPHDVSKFSEALDFVRVFPREPQRLRAPNYFANNANSAIRRDLWEQYRFDEGLPGLEDIGWARHWMELGLEVRYVPDAGVIHVHTESWPQVRRRYYREAMAARWVRIRFLRHIPGEILRELKWLAGDIFHATRRGRIFSLLYEILRFRYEKTVGTVTGIMNSRGIESPARRAAILFETEFPAVVIRAPHHASLERKTIPGLQPGEVLVRVSHVGICATDLEILEGSLGYYKTGMAKYPIVPGHELSGTIVSLGPGVTGFYEGDRVVVECIQGCGECKECQSDSAIRCTQRREVGVIGQDGGYAAYVLTRARYAHEIPDDLPLNKAALAEPMAVVVKGLRRIPGGIGSTPRKVAVIGAGAIGHLAARVLALRGHDVTVFDRDEGRLALLNGSVSTSTRLEDLGGFEWIVEATGDQNALTTVLQRSATGATLLLMGLPYAEQPFSFESIVGFDRTVVGSVGSSSADFEEAIGLLRSIDATPFLQTTFPLHEFEHAWAAVRSRKPLKVMLWVDAMPVAG